MAKPIDGEEGQMGLVRAPAVAGTFYPGDARELAAAVEALLAAARGEGAEPNPPKAIIAPHAGYIYSGPVAASIYARLGALRRTLTR
ncbi:MAG: AmmeMemoRadiSam system protein B, partial [Pseudomonadota bacterium]